MGMAYYWAHQIQNVGAPFVQVSLNVGIPRSQWNIGSYFRWLFHPVVQRWGHLLIWWVKFRMFTQKISKHIQPKYQKTSKSICGLPQICVHINIHMRVYIYIYIYIYIYLNILYNNYLFIFIYLLIYPSHPLLQITQHHRRRTPPILKFSSWQRTRKTWG